MSTTYREGLLRDADLIIAYAARAGVQLDESIYKARDDFKSNISDEQFSTSALEGAISTALSITAPVNLVHLRNDETPLSYSSNVRDAHKGSKRLIFVFSAIVMLLIIIFTHHVQEEQGALKALTEVSNEQFDQLFRRVVTKLQSGSFSKASDAAAFSDFMEDAGGLIQLARRRVTASALANDANTWTHFWTDIYASPKASTQVMMAASPKQSKVAPSSTSPATEMLKPEVEHPKKSPTLPDTLTDKSLHTKLPPSAHSEAGGMKDKISDSAKAPAAAAQPTEIKSEYLDSNDLATVSLFVGCYATSTQPLAGSVPLWPWVPAIDDFNNIKACIGAKLGLGIGADASFNYAVYQLASDLDLYLSWILPLLYGALGSIVFLMRNLNNVRTPNLGLFDTVFRVALGGIAGIAIGWFSLAGGDKFSSSSNAHLGFAFVAGLSIDLLFTVIDKFVIGASSFVDVQTPKRLP